MKKKLLFVLMICAILAVTAVVFVGCKETKLANPRNLNMVDGYFTWGAVDGADGYLIYFNDDLINRYYVQDTYLAIDSPEIRSSLKSGTVNYMYIRAVNLDKNNLPTNESDRSLIKFDYSRQLATPNKVTLKGDKFSWRAVSEAKDYQAYVRRDGEEEGQLYKLNWATGTASVSGTILDLPTGSLYYVSIVACAEGYESSVPSVEVPYDRTVVNVDELQFFANVDGKATRLTEEEEDKVFGAEISVKQDSKITITDNLGNQYALEEGEIVTGDYEVKFDISSKKASLTKVTNYYVYTAQYEQGLRLSRSEEGYSIAIVLGDGMTYSVKDDQGKLLTEYADNSVNQGTAFVGGTFTITVAKESEEISVTTGGTFVDPNEAIDGKWPVTLHYNYKGSPADLVVYAEDGRTMQTPDTPSRKGYVFEGWYEDAICLIKAEFGSKMSYFKITAPTDLYAKWSEQAEQPEDPEDPGEQPEDPQPVDPEQPGTECDYHFDANGDGKCDKCNQTMPAFEQPEDTLGTIYLDASNFEWFGSDGAVINVHIWYTDGSNNNWPGAKMTLNAQGLYEAQYYTSRQVKGVIFTRNDPNPNPNEGIPTEWDRIELGEFAFDPARPVYLLKTYHHADGVTVFTGKWLGLNEAEQEEIAGDKQLYLDFRNVEWFAADGAKLYAYIWYTDSTHNAEYPGKQMTFTTDASAVHYAATVDYASNLTIAGIIFTRNDPSKPLGSDEGTWNKLEMSLEKGNLAFDGDKPSLVLESVNGNSFEGNWETWNTQGNPVVIEPQPEEPEEPQAWDGTIKIDLSDIHWFADNGCVPYLHVWYEGGAVNASYPGAKMSGGQKGIWTYKTDAAKTLAGLLVVRVNAEGTEMYNKSGDLEDNANHFLHLSESDLSEIPLDERNISEGGEQEPVAESLTLYYYNTNGWSDVYAYAWLQVDAVSQEYLGAWSGTKMTAVQGKAGWFQVAVNSHAAHVIFNNGNGGEGNQTSDLAIDSAKPYYNEGWSADMAAPAVETRTLYFYNAGSWEDVYAYAWSGDGDGAVKYLGNWAGTKMTAVEGKDGWFKVDVNTNASKVIFNNGRNEGDGQQKTDDLTIDSSKPYYKDGWNAELVEEEPWDGTLTVSITWGEFAKDGAVAYLYVWYTSDDVGKEENAAFPGVKMTDNGDGTWSGMIDTSKLFKGLIIVRCSPEGEKWNQSADIKELPVDHSLVIESMS